MRGRVFVVIAALLVGSVPALSSAGEGRGGACLGPGVGRVLEGLVKDHAFDGLAPGGYRLERLDVKPEHVELGYDDAAGPAVTVVLAEPGAADGQAPDARGPHFEHRVTAVRAPPEDARAVMLRAAMLVDTAIPAAELRGCRAKRSTYRGPMEEVRAPAPVGIGLGALQVALVIAALALGLAGPRRGRSDQGKGRSSPVP
jgi:hypothetical protein